jgi:hypothetical protein
MIKHDSAISSKFLIPVLVPYYFNTLPAYGLLPSSLYLGGGGGGGEYEGRRGIFRAGDEPGW